MGDGKIGTTFNEKGIIIGKIVQVYKIFNKKRTIGI